MLRFSSMAPLYIMMGVAGPSLHESGRAPRGEKAEGSKPGKRVNVAAALRNGEYYASMCYQQPTDSALFEEWVRG